MMSLIETTKIAYELAKKAANNELQEKLMDMREQALELQEENIALKKQIKELGEAMTLSREVLLDERSQTYWLKKADREKPEGPYCTRCWDVNKLLVRLHKHDTGGGTCLECRNYFKMIW